MTHAIRFHAHGDPDVLRWESVDVGSPGATEALVRHTAVGLNFIDVYERTGLYASQLPATPGHEAAGVIEAVGARVKGFAPGDRVAYAAGGGGAYSQLRVMPVERLVKLPAGIDDVQAAAVMLKGLTVQALLRQVHRVRKSDTLVIHAAAGGVGTIAVQWARHLGATVIAIVGSEAKANVVRSLGADHVLLLQDDWVARVRSITRGRGAHVVYDSVGKDTFFGSLDCLRPRGLMVSYGNASGPVPPVAPLELGKRGSLYLTRPTLFHFISTRSALQRAADELFDLVGRSVISVRVGQTYPLQDAARAHRDLESRQTTGSTVLLV
ncbi:MAG TPA: quinone oxidoreductase [Povalibacter sp.]|uniref:quinone oxidoreductase family protein n=1 Tax=Povalibacter sp. TaxID=1962978 RepID=UPI002CBBFF40|nr:quinone oxidoreductase [Povalibacter sp.]HMN44748.1 quinone oxidoreductase [Povalibacter sp.]